MSVKTASTKKGPIVKAKLPDTRYADFIKNHYVDAENPLPTTNTRIKGDHGEIKMGGGNFHIPDQEYPAFLKLYAEKIVATGGLENLTEKQLEEGPILIDVDLKYGLDIRSRLHNENHIEDLVDILADELSKMLQFDENTNFNIYIQQKPDVNVLEDKGITKDGVHVIVGVKVDRRTQADLRKRIIPRIRESWADLPIKNVGGWEDVIDDAIASGTNGWQMYGSRKPNHDVYRLCNIFNIQYDTDDNSIQRHETPLESFDIVKNIEQLSARCTTHPAYFFTSEYISERSNSPVSITSNRQIAAATRRITGTVDTSNVEILRVSTQEQLKNALANFLDELVMPQEYDLKEAHDYTMILPDSYYGIGSFVKWIRVGWALRNISDRLFIVWVAFSAKAPNFSYSSISDLFNSWQTFDLKNPKGLTKRSIMHWAKQDAPELYKRVRATTIDHYIDQTVKAITLDNLGSDKSARGCGDSDLANVLYQMYKDEFVCVSVKNNVWYKLKGHRWVENDSGTTLRKAISTIMRDLYWNRASAFMEQATCIDPPDEERTKRLQEHADKILKICERLGRANEKKNIMTEAKELFYDSEFIKKLDSNPYLLSFKNGVIEFSPDGGGVFRKGYPEDYLSKCTNIDYAPVNEQTDATAITEIKDFMRKLFPIEEIHNYMWEHLASVLIGKAVTQTFNMYIGIGQNGKSVLMDFMSTCLGDYYAGVPLPLITDKRTKIGGLAPELLDLKGARLAVINEPSKGDQINEGMMKQLTSGIEPIQARAPYMLQSVSFVPQFKLVVCSNEFMVVKSQDHGTWRRIRVVDFVSLFTDKPVKGDTEKPYQFLIDRYITEKFASWKTVFMGMLVDIAFKTKGVVKDCDRVLSASKSYQESLDYVGDFIRDRIIVDPDGRITKQTIKYEFESWHSSNYGGKLPNIKEIHAYMDKKFGKYEKKRAWEGISIRIDEYVSQDEVDDCEEEEDANDIEVDELQ
jgi:P4 family phage/plasmid primase-like protien